LNTVGVYLLSLVYSHGQLYVAISQVTSSANIKIFSGQGPDGYMWNVVYKRGFGNVVCNCNFVICTIKYTYNTCALGTGFKLVESRGQSMYLIHWLCNFGRELHLFLWSTCNSSTSSYLSRSILPMPPPLAYNRHLHLRSSVVQIPMLHYSIQSKITKDIDCYKALLSSISNNLYKGEIFTMLREGYGMLAQHFIKIPRIQHHRQTTLFLQNIYCHLEYATQPPQTTRIYIHI